MASGEALRSSAPHSQKQLKKNRVRKPTANTHSFRAFCVCLGAVVFCVLLVSTYAMPYLQLTATVSQEKAQIQQLTHQKQELQNNIKRWDDNAFVIAQARERLGFVFPDETTVLLQGEQGVEHHQPKSYGWYKPFQGQLKKDVLGTLEAQNKSSKPLFAPHPKIQPVQGPELMAAQEKKEQMEREKKLHKSDSNSQKAKNTESSKSKNH